MKKYLFLCLLFILSAEYRAQDYSKNGVYIWNEVVMLQPSEINGMVRKEKSQDLDPIPSKSTQKFRVLQVISNTLAVIQVLDYTENTRFYLSRSKIPAKKKVPRADFYTYNFKGEPADYDKLSAEQVNGRNYDDKQLYFTIPVSVLSDEKLCKREEMIGASLAVGALNFPFKFRPQNGDISGAFNFGVAVGMNIKHKSWRKFNLCTVIGFSFSNVVLDSSNTSRNQDQLASTNNFSAGSLSGGVLLQNGRVQIGAFIGVDKLSAITQRQFGWHQQGEPWFSLGLGIGVFSPQDSQRSAPQEQ